jgi:pimeloyl-ACP methyl ester carboxylesterase
MVDHSRCDWKTSLQSRPSSKEKMVHVCPAAFKRQIGSGTRHAGAVRRVSFHLTRRWPARDRAEAAQRGRQNLLDDGMLSTTGHLVDGVRCAVHDSDPGRSTAVVFVHGNPGPMDDWAEMMPSISAFSRVVAMDMPGYGRAEHPRDFDYTISGYGRYLGHLLDHLNVERAHLVLHNFGGAWGLRWALDHPHRLASLTLINCGMLEGYKWHGFAKIWQTPIIGELSQLTTTAWGTHIVLNRMNPKPLPRSFVDRVKKYADWGHKRAVLKLYRASKDLSNALPSLASNPFPKSLPTCVIWGAGDPFVPVQFAEKQKKFFPSAEVHVLDGLGHWPFIDDVQRVLHPLEGFLKRQF